MFTWSISEKERDTQHSAEDTPLALLRSSCNDKSTLLHADQADAVWRITRLCN